jgi:hypothetical protein
MAPRALQLADGRFCTLESATRDDESSDGASTVLRDEIAVVCGCEGLKCEIQLPPHWEQLDRDELARFVTRALERLERV